MHRDGTTEDNDAIGWKARLVAALRAEGFRRVGFAPLTEVPAQEAARVREWFGRGYHGTMAYLAREDALAARLEPGKRWTWARSICCATFPYLTEPAEAPATSVSAGDSARDPKVIGKIARYAQGLDYHDLIERKLRRVAREVCEALPGLRLRSYVDTGPILERQWAARCGLGWLGKNGLLLHPEDGSYYFLASLLVSEPAGQSGQVGEEPAITDRCGSCTACLEACPTGALLAPGLLDARRCLSYATIEHRGPADGSGLPASIREQGQAGWLFGCDVCQEVCPYNRPTAMRAGPPVVAADSDAAEALRVLPALEASTLLELAEIDADTFRARFRKSPIWRATPAGLRRSARWILEAANACSPSPNPKTEPLR